MKTKHYLLLFVALISFSGLGLDLRAMDGKGKQEEETVKEETVKETPEYLEPFLTSMLPRVIQKIVQTGLKLSPIVETLKQYDKSHLQEIFYGQEEAERESPWLEDARPWIDDCQKLWEVFVAANLRTRIPFDLSTPSKVRAALEARIHNRYTYNPDEPIGAERKVVRTKLSTILLSMIFALIKEFRKEVSHAQVVGALANSDEPMKQVSSADDDEYQSVMQMGVLAFWAKVFGNRPEVRQRLAQKPNELILDSQQQITPEIINLLTHIQIMLAKYNLMITPDWEEETLLDHRDEQIECCQWVEIPDGHVVDQYMIRIAATNLYYAYTFLYYTLYKISKNQNILPSETNMEINAILLSNDGSTTRPEEETDAPGRALFDAIKLKWPQTVYQVIQKWIAAKLWQQDEERREEFDSEDEEEESDDEGNL